MAHIHEKIDFTAEVFVVFRDKVLLRMHDKYKFWLSVGGHINLDEDPNEAAVREVKEEVGLDIRLWDGNQLLKYDKKGYESLIPPIGLNRHEVIPGHEHVTLIYFAKSETDKVVVTYEGDKSEEWRWCTREDLESMDLRQDIRFYALEALKTLGSA